MHTKEVICWNCGAPNQVEESAPALLEALEKIAKYKNNFARHYTGGDVFDIQAIAKLAIRKAKEE